MTGTWNREPGIEVEEREWGMGNGEWDRAADALPISYRQLSIAAVGKPVPGSRFPVPDPLHP
jgi:hypothetical protein